MYRKLAFLSIAIAIAVSGCTEQIQEQIQKPTVSVSSINVKGITPQNLNLYVHVIIDNPNPVGANLTKVAFDIYYLENGQSKYLGHGEKYNVEVRKQGQTTVTVPVVVENQQAINALMEAAKKGAITIRTSGSAFLDLKVTTFEIPFETSNEIRLEAPR